MLDNLNWGKTQYLLEQGMNASVLRRKVIADNIANVDVPHFKRSEVSYEAQVRRALDSEKVAAENDFPTKMTHSQHLSFNKAMDYRDVHPRVHTDYLSSMRNDGNNVDIEHEMSLSVKNQLTYQAMATLVNNNFRNMTMIIKSA